MLQVMVLCLCNTYLEVGVVKFEPLDGPGGSAGGAGPFLCVLRFLLAKARPVLPHPPQCVGPCSSQSSPHHP